MRRRIALAMACLMTVIPSTTNCISEEAEIPGTLLRFAEKYAEVRDFVRDYPEKHDLKFEINLSDEIGDGYPLLVQWDERWGYMEYGESLLGLSGCGPTALSIVVCGLKHTDRWDPATVARYAMEHGDYVKNVGTSWTLMERGARDMGLTVETGEVSADYILDNLSEYSPMICSVTAGDFTYSGHFIVLTGIDSDGKILIRDPNSLIKSRKSWDVDRLVKQIRTIWVYRNDYDAQS